MHSTVNIPALACKNVTGLEGVVLQASGSTYLVEQQDELLRCASLADIAFHISAARSKGVPGVEHLNDDISSIHDLDKLLVEGPS